jgi:spermidine/putrescine transport system substrate-binding protein
MLLSGCFFNRKPAELRVLVRHGLPDESILRNFEKTSGHPVVVDYFDHDEELIAKLDAAAEKGAVPYDLALASDRALPGLLARQRLRPLERTGLPAAEDFLPGFAHPEADPELKHSVPLAWRTVGLAVNAQVKAAAKVISWKEAFETPALKGQVTLLNDPYEVLHAGLLARGKTWAKATPEDVKATFAYLKAHRAQFAAFQDKPRLTIQRNGCAVCQAESADAIEIATGKPEIHYIIPREGASLTIDSLVIPANTPQPELAQKLLGSLLSADQARRIANGSFRATTLAKGRDQAYPQIQQNPGLYPDAPSFAKLARLTDRPELTKLIARLWSELLSN